MKSIEIAKVPNYPKCRHIVSRESLKRILLVQPPAFCNNLRGDMNPNAPLGIAYIAAVLEADGYEVKILDAFIEGWEIETRIDPEKLLVGMPYEHIEQYIREYNPDVVGVTSMFTSQRKNAHKIAEIAKAVDPKILTIFGGAHPTSAPESVLSDENVDFIVLGEGDNLIVPLIRSVEASNDVSLLDGLGYRDANNKPVVIEKRTQIDDLDTIPFPARHLLPMEKYFAAGVRHGGYSKGKRAVSMITSRGCQYRCNFCTAFKVFTRRPRMRSIDNVLAEIEQLVNVYKIDEIFFEDDQIIAKQRRAGDLFDAMAARFNLVWDTPNGVSPWLLDDEIVGKMKKAGCYRINLAIESGNQFVLDKIINKPVKLDQIPNIVSIIKSHGIEVGTFLVVGNIGRGGIETIEQIRESFSFCRKLGLFPHASLLTAYPGSDVLDIAEKNGYLVDGFEWDKLIIQKSQLITPEWTPEQLVKVVAEERVKTRWYLLFKDPVGSLGTIIHHLIREPMTTFKKCLIFITASFDGLLKKA